MPHHFPRPPLPNQVVASSSRSSLWSTIVQKTTRCPFVLCYTPRFSSFLVWTQRLKCFGGTSYASPFCFAFSNLEARLPLELFRVAGLSRALPTGYLEESPDLNNKSFVISSRSTSLAHKASYCNLLWFGGWSCCFAFLPALSVFRYSSTAPFASFGFGQSGVDKFAARTLFRSEASLQFNILIVVLRALVRRSFWKPWSDLAASTLFLQQVSRAFCPV